MTSGSLPILTYHAIDTTRSAISTDRARFVATLDALGEAGFQSVELCDWIARGRPSVERGFALAFDDGLRSILEVVGDLVERGIKATVFLVTDRMGKNNDWHGQPREIPRTPLLAWSDLDAMVRSGFAFGSHGRTHRRLDRCDDQSLESELRDSRDAIEQRLGQPCRLLAYPYGLAPFRVRRAAMRHFDAALGTRLDVATAAQDPFQLARIDGHYLRSRRRLERLLAGRASAWLRQKRILRAARRALVDTVGVTN
jgi:peptidoglycan/xylan/chitin deacetylase (PgdA/CDA1 family)